MVRKSIVSYLDIYFCEVDDINGETVKYAIFSFLLCTATSVPHATTPPSLSLVPFADLKLG